MTNWTEVATSPFGRPSVASAAAWKLRGVASCSDAGIRADGGERDGWVVRAATVVGVRHRVAGLANDDAFAWIIGAEGLVVAVADGLGSVAGSGAAAAAAARVAVETAAEALGGGAESALRAGVAAANDAVKAGPGATTLVVAVAAGDGAVTLARVGDSSAFGLSSGRWVELFARHNARASAGLADDDDGVVDTATAALPASLPRCELATAHLSAVAAEWSLGTTVSVSGAQVVILVTDGVADPLRDGPETVAPALTEALSVPPTALELAGIVDFSRQGCHDDRTLVALWPRDTGN